MTDENTIEVEESELEQLVDQKVESKLETERQSMTRRSLLSKAAAVAGAGALGYSAATGQAAADPSDATGTIYVGQIGDSDNPVSEIYTDNLVAAGQTAELGTLEIKDNNQTGLHQDLTATTDGLTFIWKDDAQSLSIDMAALSPDGLKLYDSNISNVNDIDATSLTSDNATIANLLKAGELVVDNDPNDLVEFSIEEGDGGLSFIQTDTSQGLDIDMAALTTTGLDMQSNDISNANSIDSTSVSTDDLRTPPTGSLVQLSSNQTVQDDTVTKIAWDSETSRGSVSNLLNASNEVVVPSGYNWAKVFISVDFDTGGSLNEINLFRARKNGSSFSGAGYIPGVASFGSLNQSLTTAWTPVNQGDTISFEILISTGATSETLEQSDGTAMEVVLR